MASVDTQFLPADWKPGDPIPEKGPTNSPTVTIEQSQSTSGSGEQIAAPKFTENQVNKSLSVQNNAVQQAPTSGGVGAGTNKNAYGSINADDNPTPTGQSAQLNLSTSTQALNQLIPTQPNQLDQYASYTYALSWYLLTPNQYNQMIKTQKPNLAGWSLLMQSGGAPITGRNSAFKVDYYLDNLEIDSYVVGGGSGRPNHATELRFTVHEPNGLTLIQSLYNAVVSLYKNSQQSQQNTSNNGSAVADSPVTKQTEAARYLSAQYCMVIKFYGYDKDGNLVAPAKGSYQVNTSVAGGYGQKEVIIKYYPFAIENLTYRLTTGGQASHGIEYTIKAKSIAQFYAASTDRSTIPFEYNLTGQTVAQLLNGSPVPVGSAPGVSATSKADPGTRKVTPIPNQYNIPGWNDLSSDVQMRAQQSWFDTYGRRYNADGTPNGGGG